jgi:hypothetical protein
MLTWKSDNSVMERVKGWIGAPEGKGGRIDPCALWSFSNFLIFPASRLNCQPCVFRRDNVE